MTSVPIGWSEVTLGDVVKLRGEKRQPSKSPSALYVGLENVEAHTSRILKYAKAADMKSAAARFTPGDVLYSRLRPYLNKVFKAEVEGLASAEFLVLKSSSAIEPEYLRRRIMAVDFLDFTAGLDRGDRPRVDYGQISGFTLALPPLPEQRRIVAKLDSLTARTARARSELDHIPRLVEKYKQAILTKVFSGDLTKEWRGLQRNPIQPAYDDAGIDGRAAKRPSIPTAWVWTSFGAAGTISGGLTKSPKRELISTRSRYLRVANVYANELRLDEISEIGCSKAELEKTKLEPGDLLIVEGNGSLEQIGRVAIWAGEIENCSHQNHIIRARMNRDVCARYALYWLLSPLGRSYIERVASSNAGLHTLSISKVQGLPLPLCVIDEQREAVRLIDTAFAWLDKVTAEHARASHLVPKLDQSILAKAFRGELVSQDPNDEPASALLEKIKASQDVGASNNGQRKHARKSKHAR